MNAQLPQRVGKWLRNQKVTSGWPQVGDLKKKNNTGKGMTDRLIYAWVHGVPAPSNTIFPDKS